MRLALALVAVAVTVAGCSVPDYGNGHLQCAPSGDCPSGFYCAIDRHCWLNDSGPPTADDLSAATPADLAGLVVDLAGADLGGSTPKCTNSGRLLCESFETPLLLSGWNESTHNGTLAIDGSRAFRGKSSLRSSIQASGANTSPYATVSNSKPFPIVGTLYARVWVYFSPALPPPFEQFLNFTDAGSTGISIATDNGGVALDDYAGALYQVSQTKLPLNRWVCVQFDMGQTMPAGSIHVTVDGNLLMDLPQAGTTPTTVSVLLGVDFNSNTAAVPAYDAWFDEIIVDNKPINCDD